MKKLSLLFTMMMVMAFGISLNASAKNDPKDYVGQWNMVVESSMGEMVYHVDITQPDGKTLAGEMWSDGYPEHVALQDVKTTKDGISFSMVTYGRAVPLTFVKAADGTITGTMPGNPFMKESKINFVRRDK